MEAVGRVVFIGLELSESVRCVSFWMIGGDGIDWLCGLFRMADGRHRFIYRFKYHGPVKDPFSGQDQTSAYSGESSGETDDQVRAKIDLIADVLAKRPGFTSGVCRVDVDGSPAKMMELLAQQPWAHLKQVEQE